MKEQNSDKNKKTISSTWASTSEKNIKKEADIFKLSMDQAQKAHSDIASSLQDAGQQIINETKKNTEKFMNQMGQNKARSPACENGTCSCCDHSAGVNNKEFMNNATSNIEQTIEQVTKLGYAFIKCRSTQDIMNWQHDLIKAHIDSMMRLSTFAFNNWNNLTKDFIYKG